MSITAKTMDVTFTPREFGSAPKRPRKPWTISLVQARARNENAVAAAPPSMKGLRFPHGIRQLSLLIPMYGWTSTPDNGPAIHTNANMDLSMPKERR